MTGFVLLIKKDRYFYFYEYNDSPISLFIADRIDMQNINTGKNVILKDKKILLLEDRGYNLLLWQEKDLKYTLVSELSMEEITKIM